MKINAKKMKKKICNFFNIASMVLKITPPWRSGLGCRTISMPSHVRLVSRIKSIKKTSHPPLLNPTEYGWKYNGRGMYDLNWFEGEVCPKSLDVVYEEANL